MKKGFTVKAMLELLSLNLETKRLTCLTKHGSGQSDLIKLIKVRSISARESNSGLLGGEPDPYLSAMVTMKLSNFSFKS